MFGYSIKSVVLILSLISIIHFASTIQGRSLLTMALTHDKSSSTSFPQEEAKKQEKEMAVRRASIGSRPPRCEGMCKSCGHCEAVQVPTISITVSNIEYKPITWKCKCSTSLLNP